MINSSIAEISKEGFIDIKREITNLGQATSDSVGFSDLTFGGSTSPLTLKTLLFLGYSASASCLLYSK